MSNRDDLRFPSARMVRKLEVPKQPTETSKPAVSPRAEVFGYSNSEEAKESRHFHTAHSRIVEAGGFHYVANHHTLETLRFVFDLEFADDSESGKLLVSHGMTIPRDRKVCRDNNINPKEGAVDLLVWSQKPENMDLICRAVPILAEAIESRFEGREPLPPGATTKPNMSTPQTPAPAPPTPAAESTKNTAAQWATELNAITDPSKRTAFFREHRNEIEEANLAAKKQRGTSSPSSNSDPAQEPAGSPDSETNPLLKSAEQWEEEINAIQDPVHRQAFVSANMKYLRVARMARQARPKNQQPKK